MVYSDHQTALFTLACITTTDVMVTDVLVMGMLCCCCCFVNVEESVVCMSGVSMPVARCRSTLQQDCELIAFILFF